MKACRDDSLVVVTVLIPDVIGCATGAFDGLDAFVTLGDESAVLAFAFFAVFVIFGTTTVASIPAATSVIAGKITTSNGEANA